MAKSDPADLSMMFFLHSAFRRDLDRLATAVEGLADGARQRGQELAERWDFVGEALHHHHTCEDEHLWPLARRKAPESASVLDEMQAEHRTIDPLLARVGDGFRRLAAGDESVRPALAADLRALHGTLSDHLAHEERDAVPLLARTLTEGELQAFAHSQRKAMKLSQVTMFVPWVLEGLPDPDRRKVLSSFPPPLRMLARRRWVPRYEKASAAIWA